MAETTKLGQLTQDLASAWDERKRIFDALRNPFLEDDKRQKYIDDYAKADKHFQDTKAAILKHQKG